MAAGSGAGRPPCVRRCESRTARGNAFAAFENRGGPWVVRTWNGIRTADPGVTRYATNRLSEEDPMPSKRTRPPAYLRQVGRRLRVARLGLGKSAADMCRELDTTDRAWSQWENGKRLLDVLVAVRLKECYGITLDWLYDGDPARLPPDLAEWARRGAAAEPDLAAPQSTETPRRD